MSKTAVPALFKAIEDGALKRIKKLVSTKPALLKKRNDDGETPLHAAARGSNTLEVAQFLIDRKADIDRFAISNTNPARF